MAAPTKLSCIVRTGGPEVTFPSSLQLNWTQVHSDAKQANSAADLLNPLAATMTYVIPGLVTQGTRLRLIARIAYAATVSASPVVRVFGADQVPNDAGVFPTGTLFHRIDAENFTDTGTTLTLAAAAAAQNDGATYAWSSALPVGTGWDMLGARAVIVLVETAANTSTGTVPIYAAVLN